MTTHPGNPIVSKISTVEGQLLQLSDSHAVAIYTRDGQAWAADLGTGRGEIMDANSWFRLHCGIYTMSHAWRRVAFHARTPLTEEMISRIENLHQRAESAKRAAAGVPGRRALRSLATVLARIFGHLPTRQIARLPSGAQR